MFNRLSYRDPGQGAKLGSFWYFIYFLSQAAPYTTWLLRPRLHFMEPNSFSQCSDEHRS